MKIYTLPENYQNTSRQKIFENYRRDEAACVEALISQARFDDSQSEQIKQIASDLVSKVRAKRMGAGGLDAFMSEYHLSSDEGIALMCLAESLLRIPDEATVNQLIRDKIANADWDMHLGKSDSLFVNAATWALLLTGKIIGNSEREHNKFSGVLKNLLARSSEPLIRNIITPAMKILGRQFVMGRTIEEALERAKETEQLGYRYSYDMLGEAARTAADADRYFESYRKAIMTIGASAKSEHVAENPGISVKLSALHPRYEFAKRENVLATIVPRLLELTLLAKQYHIGLTVDAEEATRLDLSLDVIEAVFIDPQLSGYHGFGLAVQSYQKRAPFVIDWLVSLARSQQRRIMIRLIKGAYWDSEIKVAQELGLEDYPVFTRKVNTDVSFLACAKKILQAPDAFYPQFATHNAHSVASILTLTNNAIDFEFQCLHGMGRPLYDEIVTKETYARPCRIYAPVGSHEDLLAYLVRRLLENGANSSFVNRIIDENSPISEIIADPVERAINFKNKRHPQIPLPRDIYGVKRLNSRGVDLTNPLQLNALADSFAQHAAQKPIAAVPLIGDELVNGVAVSVYSPNDKEQQIGSVIKAAKEDVERALSQAVLGFKTWELSDPEMRAQTLEKAADLFEKNTNRLIALLVQEGGKTLNDAIAEVREAIDFCRYYAAQVRIYIKAPMILPGPTGEHNQLELRGRGIAVCISPWNFPLAIFIGQVTAALAAGNVVIAKPADQTPLVAYVAIELLHQAGFSKQVVQLLIGRGSQVGTPLVSDPRISAVLFTGSTETAQMINQTLAKRSDNGAICPIIPFIAETGGQNAMIVDSSALAEQVVNDVIISAFTSAGQRCSALRILFVQEDIADKLLMMLAGAMAELEVGHPGFLSTDIGPVIDDSSRTQLLAHVQYLQKVGRMIYQVPLDDINYNGNYFGPCAFEIPSIKLLEREVFGPILHVIRYAQSDLDKVIADINSTGYGLTLGIHTRIDDNARYIQKRVRAGNCYINRSMIGAVVGVQPFGGEGLSGTGPKAGGPHYLLRLCTERTLSINLAATGGNTQLVSLDQNLDDE